MTKSEVELEPGEFTLALDADGRRVIATRAAGPITGVTIIPDAASYNLFHRVGKAVAGPVLARWLVAELDGVRVYVRGSEIVITKRDLYPK